MTRSLPLCAMTLLIAGCHSGMNYAIQERGARAREYIDRQLASNASPGIQYLVVDSASVLFSYAGGSADIAGARPLLDSTTMMIYSMSKTITAAAVLQLAEQGALSLDDPAADYLSDLPYGRGVTIRHLLSQTSGIPNPIPLRWVHLVEEHPHFNEQTALQAVLREHPDLDCAPGEKNGYSNISYWLLGRVIEKAAGTRYEDYVREHVFRQLHIPAGEIDFVIPSGLHHAKGYLPKWSWLNLFKSFLIDSKFVGEYEDGWLHIREHYLNGPSYGGIVASARAIGLFLQDQLRGNSRLFSNETKALFYTQQRTNAGEPVSMTPGWHIGGVDTLRYFFKEGGGGGFHSEMRIYPSRGIASVVIANNTSFGVKDLLNAVDGEFLRK